MSALIGIIVVVVLVVIGIIIAICEISEKISKKESEKLKKESEAQRQEFEKSVKKLQKNPLVCNWAKEVAAFIQHDVDKNKYKKKEYDVCCCGSKVQFVDLAREEIVLTYYFAKYDMENLSENKWNDLAYALAIETCDQLQKCGVQTGIGESEDHGYIYDDWEEDPGVCTIVYEGKKGKNKW